MTVTETWTFVFDAEGEMTASPTLPVDLTELASIPTPPPSADASDAPAAGAPAGDCEPEQ